MEVFSFLMVQSQALFTFVGLGASPVLVQVAVLVGTLIVLSFGVYYGLSLLNKLLNPSEEVAAKEKPPVKAKKKSKPSAKVKTMPAKKSEFQPKKNRLVKSEMPPKFSKLLDSEYWFYNTDLYSYLEYLSFNNPKLYIMGQDKTGLSDAEVVNVSRMIFKKTMSTYTINTTGKNLSPINNEILSDFALNKKASADAQRSIFAYPLSLSGNHWTLVLVDTEKRTIEYYDSRKNYPDKYTNESGVHYTDIDAHFKNFAKVLTKHEPAEKPYTFVRKLTTQLDEGVDDCGAWALYFLEKRLKNPDVDFNALDPLPDMQDYRYEIASNLTLADRGKDVPKPPPASSSKKPRRNT